MSLSSFISRRLSLRVGRRRLAPAIVVAIGGIAISLAVMLVAVAVVTGFKNEIRRKIMGFDAQLTITPLASYYGDGQATVVFDSALQHIIKQSVASVDGDAEPCAAIAMQQPGMLKTDNNFLGVVFKAYGDGYDWAFERSNLVDGELPDAGTPRGIAISLAMAQKLSLAVGDKVNVYFFVGETVRPRRFEITGIYCSNFGEYDDLIAYARSEAIGGLLKYGQNEGPAVEVRGIPGDRILPVADELQRNLNMATAHGDLSQSYVVTTVYSSGAAYFNWLDMLDTNIVVILVLMGCVSGFMLISCVLILILERVKMIGVLKALGATDRQVGMVFVRLGARVTGWGLILGNILALALIGAEWQWHFIPLEPDSYYLSYVPVSLTPVDWGVLNLGAFVLAFMLMLLPVGVVSRLSPVKVLRFE